MIGVVLLNMGGPDSLESVQPFLYNLFSDREIIRLGPAFLQKPLAWWIARRRAPKSRLAYERIGGSSPLTGITMKQAASVESLLREQGSGEMLCRIGMRYWAPRTPDVLRKLAEQGIRKVLGVSLYPHYSRATSGSSIGEFERCADELGLEWNVVSSFPDHPGYIEALAETVREGLSRLEGDEGKPDTRLGKKLPEHAALLYSAHSLPKKMIEQGDPYVDHLNRTIGALERLTGIKGRISFQSRSGPVAWLEPATDVMLNELAGEGFREILVVPISFVSDHVETLYEIDMLYGGMMHERGVRIVRTPSLNDRPLFIKALAGLVLVRLKEVGWLE